MNAHVPPNVPWHLQPRLKEWYVVPRTYVRSGDGKHTAFFICDAERTACALVVDDKPRVNLAVAVCDPTLINGDGHAALIGDDSEAAEVFNRDELSEDDEVDGEWGGEEPGDELDGVLPQDGVCFEEVEIFLSPDGSRAYFSFYEDGVQMFSAVTPTGGMEAVRGSLEYVIFTRNGEKAMLGARDDENKMFFIYEGARSNGEVCFSAFSYDDRHVVALVNRSENGEGPAELFLDGAFIAAYDGLQTWSQADQTAPGTDVRDTMLISHDSRYALFGARIADTEQKDGDPIPAVCIVNLESTAIGVWPGVRILQAKWDDLMKQFELVVLSGHDGFRVPMKMTLPFHEEC